MKKILTLMLISAMTMAASAQTKEIEKDPNIKNPAAPFTSINLMEIEEVDIAQFVSDWNERSKIMGQQTGYISVVLYKSLLPDSQYKLIAVGQWQSYDAWVAANNDPKYAGQLVTDSRNVSSLKVNCGFYRPAASSMHFYSDIAQDTKKTEKPLERAVKDPNIKNPEASFVFINLMEMDQADVGRFVADWQVRSRIMGQMPAAIGSILYKSILADNRYQIVNVSQWQSYDGFIAANNDPTYAVELSSDLGQTPSIKLTRGFYRPIAAYTHIYE